MQLRPRLTGASGSPWVATIRPSLVPTSTLQPVPQNLHGALSQRILSLPAARAGLSAGMLIPAAVAAAVAAFAFINSRREMLIPGPPPGFQTDRHIDKLMLPKEYRPGFECL